MYHVNVIVAAIASAPGDGNSTFNTLKMYNRNISLVVCCISSSSTDSLLLLPGEGAVLYWSLNNNLEYSTTIIAHTHTQSLFIHSEMPMVLLLLPYSPSTTATTTNLFNILSLPRVVVSLPFSFLFFPSDFVWWNNRNPSPNKPRDKSEQPIAWFIAWPPLWFNSRSRISFRSIFNYQLHFPYHLRLTTFCLAVVSYYYCCFCLVDDKRRHSHSPLSQINNNNNSKFFLRSLQLELSANPRRFAS